MLADYEGRDLIAAAPHELATIAGRSRRDPCAGAGRHRRAGHALAAAGRRRSRLWPAQRPARDDRGRRPSVQSQPSGRIQRLACRLLRRASKAERASVAPVFAAGDLRALGERGELGPDHFGIEAAAADMDREAAIDAGDHPLAADQIGDSGRCAARPARDARYRSTGIRSRRGRGSCPRAAAPSRTGRYSWAWRGLAASNKMAAGLAVQTMSMMSASGTSQ